MSYNMTKNYTARLMTYDDANWISEIEHFTGKGNAVHAASTNDIRALGTADIVSFIDLFENERARGFDRNFSIPMVFELDGTPVLWEVTRYGRVSENDPWYQFHDDDTTYHCFGRSGSALTPTAPRHLIFSHSGPIAKAYPGMFEHFTGLSESLLKSFSSEVVNIRPNSTFEEVKYNRRILDSSFKMLIQAQSRWCNVSEVQVFQKFLRYHYYSPIEGTWSDPIQNVAWVGELAGRVDPLTEEEKTEWLLNSLPIQGGLSHNAAFAPNNRGGVDISKVYLDPTTQTFTYPDDSSVTSETLANALFPGDFPLYVKYRATLF